MNTFGNKWSFTSFGESHGKAIGGVLDGIPAGIHIDLTQINEELQRRAGHGRPGVSQRAQREKDQVEWLSGVMEVQSSEYYLVIKNGNAITGDRFIDF